MAPALPLILAALAGFALVLVLTALWQSMRLVLHSGSAQEATRRANVAATGGAPNPRAEARDALLREKATLLQAIRDVRFEHDLGKVSDGDLERLDAQYRVRARAVLAELDAQLAPYRDKARALLGVSEDGTAVSVTTGGSITSVAAVSPVFPISAEAASTPEPPEPPGATTTACAACATVNDVDAVFCKKCGARMASEAAS